MSVCNHFPGHKWCRQFLKKRCPPRLLEKTMLSYWHWFWFLTFVILRPLNIQRLHFISNTHTFSHIGHERLLIIGSRLLNRYIPQFLPLQLGVLTSDDFEIKYFLSITAISLPVLLFVSLSSRFYIHYLSLFNFLLSITRSLLLVLSFPLSKAMQISENGLNQSVLNCFPEIV